jgi:hypothetical protein
VACAELPRYSNYYALHAAREIKGEKEYKQVLDEGRTWP